MTNATLMELDLGPLEAMPNPGAREFSPPSSGAPDDYFLVRRGAAVSRFTNVCPHMGNPLNWAPNRFLGRDGNLILCPHHGAIYDPLTGACRGGPCNGRGLTRWPMELRGGRIIVSLPTE
ncbi:MAG: Rieske (2Fe-2S) protein [Gammaproteobacteria bacterium]